MIDGRSRTVSHIISSAIHCHGVIIPTGQTRVSHSDVQFIQTRLSNFFFLCLNTAHYNPTTLINPNPKQQQQQNDKNADLEDIAAVFFTSGSTSIRKAVPLTGMNLNVVSFTKHKVLSMSSSTIYLHLSPIFHLGGFSSAHATSSVNATHVFSSPIILYALAVQRYWVTHLVGAPSVLSTLAGSCTTANKNVRVCFVWRRSNEERHS